MENLLTYFLDLLENSIHRYVPHFVKHLRMFAPALVAGGFLFCLSLILIELFKFSGIVQSYLYFELWEFIGLYLFFVVCLRIFFNDIYRNLGILSVIKKTNTFLILPIAVIFSCALFLIENYTYTNFVFSVLGLNYLVVTELLLLSYFFLVSTSSVKTLLTYWPVLVFFSFLLSCLFLYIYYFGHFHHLSANLSLADDGKFMEQIQVKLLLGGAIIAGCLAFLEKIIMRRLLYVAVLLFFIVLAGEEVSWGSHLFSFPTFLTQQNYQKEVNIHNFPVINEITALLYVFAFLYALGSWGLYKIVKIRGTLSKQAKMWWEIFCFKGNEVIFFFPTFIINPYAAHTIIPGFPPPLDFVYQIGLIPDFGTALNFLAHWKESLEVLFYAGLVIHFFVILLNQLRVKKSRG